MASKDAHHIIETQMDSDGNETLTENSKINVLPELNDSAEDFDYSVIFDETDDIFNQSQKIAQIDGADDGDDGENSLTKLYTNSQNCTPTQSVKRTRKRNRSYMSPSTPRSGYKFQPLPIIVENSPKSVPKDRALSLKKAKKNLSMEISKNR